LKVLHIETGMQLYGGALQVTLLVRGLAERGVDSLLLCPLGSAVSAEGYPERVSVFAMPMRGDLDLPFIWRVKRMVRRFHPDVIHLHSRRGADWLGGIGARLSGVPVVLTRRVTSREPHWLVPLKYRLFDRVITISRAIRDGLVGAGVPESDIRVVHSAVPRPDPVVQWPRERLLSEFGLPADALILGMAGQFIPRKGHDVLLKALPKILEHFPRARILLFGKGALEEDVRRRAQAAGLSDAVRFTGFRDDLTQFLGCLDVLVHPAFDEGLGIILLQACAAAVPVVATPVGGIPEIIRDRVNGLVVPPGDPGAMAAAVTQLLQARDLRIRLGRAGREIAEQEFSVDRMVEGNLSVYREVLE
jgi:glycosyltransferase involved in cell wall biosynthesis